MKLLPKHIYLILLIAVFLDSAVIPWLWGGWVFKTTLAVLPFIFLFAPERHIKYLFIISLIYFRVAGSFNLGVLFLGLIVFLIYERWFLKNFFNKTAWQSLVLASAGIALFYAVILGLNRLLVPDSFYSTGSMVISIVFSMVVSAGLNFLLNKIYRLE